MASGSSALAQETSNSWLSAVSGDWFTASYWSAGVPNNSSSQTFDATIGATGPAYTVLLQYAQTATVNSLTLSSASATLEMAGTSSLTLGSLNLQGGSLQLYDGATLNNATVSGTGSVSLNGGFLNAVTLGANSVESNGEYTTITNGLTLANSTVDFQGSQSPDTDTPSLTFQGTQTFGGTGSVLFDGARGYYSDTATVDTTNGTLTIAPGITIETVNGPGGVGGGANGTWINQGTIWSNASNYTMQLAGSWTNNGTLVLTSGTLALGGQFNTSDIGTISRTGGTLEINGMLNNVGQTLTISPSTTGNVLLVNASPYTGIINGGTVAVSGGAVFSSGGLLENATLQGTMVTGYGAEFSNLTLGSSGVLSVASDAYTENGITGAGIISLDGGTLYGTTSGIPIVIGSGVTVRAGADGGGSLLIDSLVNEGTIIASGSGETVRINAGLSSTYEPYPWSNQGMLEATNGGTLRLFGEIPAGGLGNFDSAGGTIIIEQKLFNTDNTLDLNGTGNILTLGALLIGGTVQSSGGAEIQVSSTSGLFSPEFQGVTLDSDVGLLTNANLYVDSTTTIAAGNRYRMTGPGATLHNAGFLSGQGSVTFESYSDSIDPGSGIGPGMTVMTAGGSGSVGLNYTQTHNFVNEGTLLAQTAEQILTLPASTTWQNQGTMSVSAGTFQANAPVNNENIINVSGGIFYLGAGWTNAGTINLTGGTLILAGSFNPSNIGTINQSTGVINIAGNFNDTANTTTGNLTDTGTITVEPSGSLTVNGALQIYYGGILNITSSVLTINYGAAPDPIGIIEVNLASGYYHDTWTGRGIVSSIAAANPGVYAVGYADGNTDAGTSAAPNQILVQVALAGDAYLDGIVGFPDLLIVAQNYGKTGQDWAHGDFNYDGIVNFPDLLVVAQNYGKQLSAGELAELPGSFAAQWELAEAEIQIGGQSNNVPEPAATALLSWAGLSLLRRRRRKMS